MNARGYRKDGRVFMEFRENGRVVGKVSRKMPLRSDEYVRNGKVRRISRGSRDVFDELGLEVLR